MAVLSNNGRLITTLPISDVISGSDELIIQSGGATKRVYYTTISSSIFSSLTRYAGQVSFTNVNNTFTGSFSGNSTGTNVSIIAGSGLTGGGVLTSNRTLNIDTTSVVTISDNQAITGNKIFSSIVASGSLSGSYWGKIFSKNTEATGSFKGTNNNLSGSFSGSTYGYFKGDIYTLNGNKVLENGTSANPGGNVPSAYFYGTSSYANQAQTAAYAASVGPASNGLPSGGTQYQVLHKLTGTNYDAGWVNPITASTSGISNHVAIWDGARTLKTLSNLYYDAVNGYVFDVSIRSNYGIVVPVANGGAFTGSYVGNQTSVTIESPSDLYKKIYGHKYSSVFLELSASGYCTMSLMRGQTSTVFVQNSGNFKVLKWSGSLDGGATANTKIYWKNGLSASISQGNLKKDIITFVNINDKIFGTAINNFE